MIESVHHVRDPHRGAAEDQELLLGEASHSAHLPSSRSEDAFKAEGVAVKAGSLVQLWGIGDTPGEIEQVEFVGLTLLLQV